MSGVADVTVAVFLMFPPIAIAKVGLVRSTVLAIRLVDGLLRQRQNIVRCFKSTSNNTDAKALVATYTSDFQQSLSCLRSDAQ